MCYTDVALWQPASWAYRGCVVRPVQFLVSTVAQLHEEPPLCFMQIHAYEQGWWWAVWPRSSRRTGWVMEKESQVSVSLPGERVSWLWPGLPTHHQDTMPLHFYPASAREKYFPRHECIYTVKILSRQGDKERLILHWDCQCVSLATGFACVLVCVCVMKAGTLQGFSKQKDTGVQSPAGSWRTLNMLTKIKHQVCAYAL